MDLGNCWLNIVGFCFTVLKGEKEGDEGSSIKQFHFPQLEHCPCHLGLDAPHSEQKNRVFNFFVFISFAEDTSFYIESKIKKPVL